MKTKVVTYIALAVAFLMACGSTFAHHGNASFDTSKHVEMKATVVQLLWINPHSILKFDVKDDKGNVVHWMGELSSPVASSAKGWSRDSVRPGDVITVYVSPSKAGTPFGELSKVVLADGTTLDGR